MAIKAPKWVARLKAKPTAKGWVVEKAKGKTELVKAAHFTPADIAQWYAVQGVAEAAPAPKPVVQTLHEAPVEETPLTEAEIEYHYAEDEVEVEVEEDSDDTDI
jgi:hypothetical protein